MIDAPEVVSVSDDDVVLCYPAVLGPVAVAPAIGEGASNEVVEPPEIIEPARIVNFASLQPDTAFNLEGLAVRTLPRPDGELLAQVATVNDLHFGETVCGELGTVPVSPKLRDPEGTRPHPELMNEAVVASIQMAEETTGRRFDAVVAKGDLTDTGTDDQFASFLDRYGTAFPNRLHWVRGNHDAQASSSIPRSPYDLVELDGATLALLDTCIDDVETGTLSQEQLDWLDSVASEADGPVLVFGHHHPARPGGHGPDDYYFGISPRASASLVEVVARRPKIAGYFAGHTHRNRVRYFTETGPVPFVEVAAVKDFPGSWAEYRVFETGILQVHRRATQPEALAWAEATRVLYGGLYGPYAMGRLEDRCLAITTRG
jgi:Icc protein